MIYKTTISSKKAMFIYTSRLYWKSVSETVFHQIDVAVPAYTVDNLSPNSQYIIYIVAMSKNGKSLPSETLIAWTDPAYPAFVEVCRITLQYIVVLKNDLSNSVFILISIHILRYKKFYNFSIYLF